MRMEGIKRDRGKAIATGMRTESTKSDKRQGDCHRHENGDTVGTN